MKNKIVQFVCFATNIGYDEFLGRWEHFAKRFMKEPQHTILDQQGATKNKYKYVSQHEWPEADFQFSFMEGRTSETFPEHFVKVVQAGGYTPVQVNRKAHEESNLVKVIAFLSHNDYDISFYKDLPLYKYLNIYEAYYENCNYGHILEFFVQEKNWAELTKELKARPGIEMGTYTECAVLQH
jgi:hypothetical protein